MKTLILMLFLSLSLFGEMGDCLTCHPKLTQNIQTDERHKDMLSCIKCHTKNKTSVPECGDKCFSCHSKEDMYDENIPEHEVFENCRECHVTKIHKLFDPSISPNQSHMNPMQDLLMNY